MRVINALKIAINNFGLVFKNLLYKTIVFIIFATGVWLTLKISLKPFIENLQPVIQDIIEIIKGIVRGGKEVSATDSASLSAHFDEFVQYLKAHVGSIAATGIICVLIVYLYRFVAGISDATLMILVDGHMSSLSHRKYLGVMFENLKKIAVYQLIDAVLAIVYYAVVCAIEYFLVGYLIAYAPAVVLFVAACVLVFAATLYSTCLSQVMTNMIIGGMGVKEAFAKGLFPQRKYFWKMFAAYLSVIIAYVYLAVSSIIFTFGVGTVLVSSFCALMIVAMRLVDYYIIHVRKYFIDYDNIIIPKELRENDEQLLNKVDI